jgi:hypothetical protein
LKVVGARVVPTTAITINNETWQKIRGSENRKGSKTAKTDFRAKKRVKSENLEGESKTKKLESSRGQGGAGESTTLY